MRTDHTNAESTEPPTPVEGDPEAPQEGEDAGGAPRTEPGNPGVDPERMKRAEEDFERAGGN